MKRLGIPFTILVFLVLLSLPSMLSLAEPNHALPATGTPVTNTIVLQVAAWDDDTSVQLGTGENRNDWVWIRIGTSTNETRYVNGFRFLNVAIPPGARIKQATLSLYKSEWHTDFPINLDARAEAADSALSFSSSNPLASERPLTAASVTWKISSPPPNYDWFDSPNLAGVVQEVIDRPGWQSHNDLAIIIKSTEDTTSQHYLDAQSYDFSPSRAPKLEIVYETDVPIPTSTPTLTPTPTITPTPEPGRLAIEQAKDIRCDDRLVGDTRTWDNNVVAYTSCRPAWPETGPESVYRLELPYDKTDVQLQVFPQDSAQDLDIFLLTGAYPDECLRGADASLALSNMDAGVYYVAVDGYNGASGDFTLISSCSTRFEHGVYLPLLLQR